MFADFLVFILFEKLVMEVYEDERAVEIGDYTEALVL